MKGDSKGMGRVFRSRCDYSERFARDNLNQLARNCGRIVRLRRSTLARILTSGSSAREDCGEYRGRIRRCRSVLLNFYQDIVCIVLSLGFYRRASVDHVMSRFERVKERESHGTMHGGVVKLNKRRTQERVFNGKTICCNLRSRCFWAQSAAAREE